MKKYSKFYCLLLLSLIVNSSVVLYADNKSDYVKKSMTNFNNSGSLNTTLDIDDNILSESELKKEDGYIINFNNINIIEVVRFISKISGINFVFEESDLKFNVTIVSKEPTSLDNIMAALLQELRIHDLSLLQQGNTIIIHKNPNISSPPALVELVNNAPIATRLFHVKNVFVDNVRELVQPYLSNVAIVNSLKDTGHLLITDLASNVDRIAELIYMLDSKSEQVEVGYYQATGLEANMLIDLAQKVLEPIAGTNIFRLIAQPIDQKVYIVAPSHLLEKSIVVLMALDTGRSIEDSKQHVQLARENKTSSEIAVKNEIGLDAYPQEVEQIRENILIEQLESNLRQAKQEKDLNYLKQRQAGLEEDAQNLQKEIAAAIKMVSSVNIEDKKDSINSVVNMLRGLQSDLEKRSKSFWADLEKQSENIKKDIEAQDSVDKTNAKKELLSFINNLKLYREKMEQKNSRLNKIIDDIEADLIKSYETKLQQQKNQIEYKKSVESKSQLLQEIIEEIGRDRSDIEFGSKNEELSKQLVLFRNDLAGLNLKAVKERENVIGRIEKMLLEDKAQRVDERKASLKESRNFQEDIKEVIQDILRQDRKGREDDIQKEINVVLKELEVLKSEARKNEQHANADRLEKLDILKKFENNLKVLEQERSKKVVVETKEKDLLKEFLQLIRTEIADRENRNIGEVISSIEELENSVQKIKVVETTDDLHDAIVYVEKIVKSLGDSLENSTFDLSKEAGERLARVEKVAYELNLMLKEESLNQRQQLRDNFLNVSAGFKDLQDKLDGDIGVLAKLIEKVEKSIKNNNPKYISDSQNKNLEKIVNILKQELSKLNSDQMISNQQSLQVLIEEIKKEFHLESKLRQGLILELDNQLKVAPLQGGSSDEILKKLQDLKEQEKLVEQIHQRLNAIEEEMGSVVKAQGQDLVDKLEKVISAKAKKQPLSEDINVNKMIADLKNLVSKQSSQNKKQQDLRDELVVFISQGLKKPALDVQMSSDFFDQLRSLVREESVRAFSDEREELVKIIEEKINKSSEEFSKELIDSREDLELSWFDRLVLFKNRLKAAFNEDRQKIKKSEKVSAELQSVISEIELERNRYLDNISKEIDFIKNTISKDEIALKNQREKLDQDEEILKQKLSSLESKLIDIKNTIVDANVSGEGRDLSSLIVQLKESVSLYPEESERRNNLIDQAENVLVSIEKGKQAQVSADSERVSILSSLHDMMAEMRANAEVQQKAYDEQLEVRLSAERQELVSSLKSILESSVDSKEKKEQLAKLQELEWSSEELKEQSDKASLRNKLSEENRRKRVLERTMRSKLDRKSVLDMFPSLDLPGIGTGIIEDQSDFIVYKLEHQSGEEISSSLRAIADGLGSGAAPGLRLSLDNIRYLPSTNSILATGSPEVLNKIKALIANMDIPVKQVFIEMLVIDASISDSLTFGVEWGVHTRHDDIGLNTGGGFYDTESFGQAIQDHNANSGVLSATDTPFTSNGFSMGVIGRVLTHDGKIFNTLGALVKALTTDVNTNIVLNPQVVTEEGNTAEIFVGQSLRQLKESITQPGGGGNTQKSYETIDIGTRLKVTPRLGNKVDVITLDIEQIVEEAVSSASGDDDRIGPDSNSNKTKTKVHVPDQNFLILSGMIREKDRTQEVRVPILSRIPFIGALFKKTITSKDKRNLMIFIRPHILRDSDDVREVTETRKQIHGNSVKFDSYKFEVDSLVQHINW